jgi:Putative zinc-finger
MSEMMNCEKVARLLPPYLEGELPDADRLAVEAHARACAACGALIGDIERITREAAMLPPLTPSRDLWSGIEARISAPVIPMAASAGNRSRTFGLRRQWMTRAAAAAALLVTTAGITYIVTSWSRQSVARSPTRVAQAPLPPAPVAAANGTQTEAGTAPVTGGTGSSGSPARTDPASPQVASARTARGTESGAPARSVSDNSAADQTGAAYTPEITALERIIEQRSSTLDPATVLIIERNLRVIDAAIAQSKDALGRDPASKLLYDQLTHTLDKKVELLRTAAGLPSTT